MGCHPLYHPVAGRARAVQVGRLRHTSFNFQVCTLTISNSAVRRVPTGHAGFSAAGQSLNENTIKDAQGRRGAPAPWHGPGRPMQPVRTSHRPGPAPSVRPSTTTAWPGATCGTRTTSSPWQCATWARPGYETLLTTMAGPAISPVPAWQQRAGGQAGHVQPSGARRALAAPAQHHRPPHVVVPSHHRQPIHHGGLPQPLRLAR
jgi:hypothetical protein